MKRVRCLAIIPRLETYTNRALRALAPLRALHQVPFNGSCITTRIVRCGSEAITITDSMRACLDPRFADVSKIVISSPPLEYGGLPGKHPQP